MNRSPTPPVSRRDRPAKTPLNRELIAEVAFQKLAEEGPAGLTLRKVAAALDTGPASLYVYIDNAAELRDLTLDMALGEIEYPNLPQDQWRTELKSILSSYLNVLLEKPGLGQLAMTAIPTGANALRLYEAILKLLSVGGAKGANAAWGVDLLTLYCAAQAAEKDLWRTRKQPLAPITRALEQVQASDYPYIAATKHVLASGDGSSRMEWALDLLIEGILNAPTPREAQ